MRKALTSDARAQSSISPPFRIGASSIRQTERPLKGEKKEKGTIDGGGGGGDDGGLQGEGGQGLARSFDEERRKVPMR